MPGMDLTDTRNVPVTVSCKFCNEYPDFMTGGNIVDHISNHYLLKKFLWSMEHSIN